MGTFPSSSSWKFFDTYWPTCSFDSSPIPEVSSSLSSYDKYMKPSDEPSSNERSSDELSSNEQSSDEPSPYVQHTDGPSDDGDPSCSSDIQFKVDRFYSKLPMLDDDDNNNDPTTSLLPSFAK